MLYRAGFSSRFRKLTGMNKKRCTHIMRLSDLNNEWHLRINKIKLTKGYDIPGETRMMINLKRRRQSMSHKIIKGNRRLLRRYRLRYIDRIVQKMKES